jgi:hypothetical protein
MSHVDASRHEHAGGTAGSATAGIPEDAYLSLRTLSGYAGLSIRTLRSYLGHPSYPLPHFRVGGKVLVRRSDYDRWMFRFRANVSCTVTSTVDDVLRRLL